MQNHQMADLVTPGGYSIMTRGEGNYVYDIQGRKYIDGMAGLFLKNIGHRWPEIAEAVSEQMTTLAYANSGAYSTVPGILLAKKVAELAPGDLNRVFFCGGGSEAVEIATKLARQYQFITGNTSRTKIISRRGQYHGSTTTAMSIGNRGRRTHGMFEPFQPNAIQVDPPYCYRCPWGFQDRTNQSCCMLSVKSLENIIEGEGADTIAAFIGTPIPSGNQIPAAEYWPSVRELCDKTRHPSHCRRDHLWIRQAGHLVRNGAVRRPGRRHDDSKGADQRGAAGGGSGRFQADRERIRQR